MKQEILFSKVLPVMLEGSSRRSLPDKAVGELAVLSLLGQALQFERPAGPDAFVAEVEIPDERRVLPDGLRRPLIRLLQGKLATDHPALALARAFERSRLRPHPFDLPALDSFVRSYAESLGATAQHWAKRQDAEVETFSYFDPEDLDEENWTKAPLGRRVEFLRLRRKQDAEAARVLLEASWAQEEAEARFRFLQELQTQLSVKDQAFLSALGKDRAPRVRALAARFLSRLGAGGENAALGACLERIKKGDAGLRLELPANVKAEDALRWIVQTFGEVSLAEIAGALQLSEWEVVAASSKDGNLLFAWAVLASSEGRLDVFEAVVEALPDVWERMAQVRLDVLGAVTEAEREAWVSALARPFRKNAPTSYPMWDWLHRALGASVPVELMRLVLQEGLPGKLGESEVMGKAWLELFAAICPAALRRELGAQLPAVELLEILDGMEKVRENV